MICISELNFSPITLDDRERILDVLSRGSRATNEYSFATAFMWRYAYDLSACIYADRLIVRSDEKDPTYVFPSGGGDMKTVVDALLEHERVEGRMLTFNMILPEDAEQLKVLYPDVFEFEDNRDGYDYLYDTQSLITLSGRKLSSKRNHINRFQEIHPEWVMEPITPENLDEVRAMNRAWCKEAGCADNESLALEHCAVEQALHHMQELKQDGALIRSRGQIMAFALGEPLNDSTYVVHVEKAIANVQGAYQLINREFAAKYAKDYALINREDDAGDPGLRRAKMSYRPSGFVVKWIARQVREV